MNLKTPSKLEKILAAGHLAVTSECGPPRGSDPEVITRKAEMIKDHVDAINITDNQTSVTRMCSLAACIRLKLMGLEPVLQMVTRDRNRIALQSDILGAAAFDIHNILCLSGDHQSFGDCAQGQNVHDLDSMQLIQTVRHMRDEGKFLGGHRSTKKREAAPRKFSLRTELGFVINYLSFLCGYLTGLAFNYMEENGRLKQDVKGSL